jgi:putative exporter of polyketide antibiotics
MNGIEHILIVGIGWLSGLGAGTGLTLRAVYVAHVVKRSARIQAAWFVAWCANLGLCALTPILLLAYHVLDDDTAPSDSFSYLAILFAAGFAGSSATTFLSWHLVSQALKDRGVDLFGSGGRE